MEMISYLHQNLISGLKSLKSMTGYYDRPVDLLISTATHNNIALAYNFVSELSRPALFSSGCIVKPEFLQGLVVEMKSQKGVLDVQVDVGRTY